MRESTQQCSRKPTHRERQQAAPLRESALKRSPNANRSPARGREAHDALDRTHRAARGSRSWAPRAPPGTFSSPSSCDSGPRRFEVRSEVPLSAEPLRADYLFLSTDDVVDDVPARTLKRLWEHITKDAIVELKSVGRPYRSRNLYRHWAYLHLHYTDQHARLKQPSDLVGVLVVPVRSPSLDADVAALGLSWNDLGGGYAELTGGPFALYVEGAAP